MLDDLECSRESESRISELDAVGTVARLWRVTTALIVPTQAPMAPDGGLPQKLEFHSRMPEQTQVYGDITIAIRKPREADYSQLYGNNPQNEVVELVADVPAGSEVMSAIEKLAPMLESLVDLISFEMGASLGLGQMTVTDITPPLSIGDERASSIFTGSPLDRNARAVEMQAIQGVLLGQLPERTNVGDRKTAAVLRWFTKALSTDLLHDQFIFLWIALEILCDDSEVRVLESYVGPCDHEIAACPTCGEPTTRMVRGATMKAFLERFGVSEEQAKQLWQMRQLMHGAIPFDSERLVDLPSLVQPLRAVVATGLKDRLGMDPADPPIVAATGLSIRPAMGMSGTCKISEDDTKPLIPPSQGQA